MIIALHYCRKDQHLALALAEWLAEIGPFPNHDFLIFRDHRAANASFGGIDAQSVKEIVITDDVANFWPASANHAFKKIAKYVEYSCGGAPFLNLEADCVVLRGSAFNEVEEEFGRAIAAGKKVLGDLQDAKNNRISPGFVNHCSGVAVYSGRMTHYAGEVFYAGDTTPFDIVAGPQFYSQAQQSKLILHVWNREGKGLAPFKDWSDVEQKIFARRPKCALFHSDKTGTLLGLLRERKNFSGGVESRHADTEKAGLESSFAEKPSADVAPSGSSAPPAENLLPTSQPESSAETVPLGGTGAHGIECTCLKRDFPCPFHFRDYEHTIDDAKAVYDKLAYQKFAQTLQTPWAIKEWSVSEIKLLAARLRQFQTNVAYVRFVRSLLAEAGVIVLPKKKRRKKRK